MANDYLLLYSGGSMPESEEEQATVMKAWDAWMHDLGSALKDGGNPFAPKDEPKDEQGPQDKGGFLGQATHRESQGRDGRLFPSVRPEEQEQGEGQQRVASRDDFVRDQRGHRVNREQRARAQRCSPREATDFGRDHHHHGRGHVQSQVGGVKHPR